MNRTGKRNQTYELVQNTVTQETSVCDNSVKTDMDLWDYVYETADTTENEEEIAKTDNMETDIPQLQVR